jgi:soluble lytic murein transglycosylase-like protein
LITAVIDAESSFRPDVVSSKGAMGLMQIMPETAKRFNLFDPFDPYQNIDCGARYLKYLLLRFHGNMRFALAAYNAGETQVEKYGTVPPFKETTTYVRKVLNSFKTLERKRNLIYKSISPKGTIVFTDDLQTKFTK